ncbi:MAG: hypothetical protein ACOCP8_01330 [archaeon]
MKRLVARDKGEFDNKNITIIKYYDGYNDGMSADFAIQYEPNNETYRAGGNNLTYKILDPNDKKYRNNADPKKSALEAAEWYILKNVDVLLDREIIRDNNDIALPGDFENSSMQYIEYKEKKKVNEEEEIDEKFEKKEEEQTLDNYDYNYDVIEFGVYRRNIEKVDSFIEEGIIGDYIKRHSIQPLSNVAFKNKHMLTILSFLNTIKPNSRLRKVAFDYLSIIDNNIINDIDINSNSSIIATYYTGEDIEDEGDPTISGMIAQYNDKFIIFGPQSDVELTKLSNGKITYIDNGEQHEVQMYPFTFEKFIKYLQYELVGINNIKLVDTYQNAELELQNMQPDIKTVLPHDSNQESFLENNSQLYQEQISEEITNENQEEIIDESMEMLRVKIWYEPNERSKRYLNNWIKQNNTIIHKL